MEVKEDTPKCQVDAIITEIFNYLFFSGLHNLNAVTTQCDRCAVREIFSYTYCYAFACISFPHWKRFHYSILFITEAIISTRAFMIPTHFCPSTISSSSAPDRVKKSKFYHLNVNCSLIIFLLFLSGGSVVANRLSEIAHFSVLILEAGGEENFISDVPLTPSVTILTSEFFSFRNPR